MNFYIKLINFIQFKKVYFYGNIWYKEIPKMTLEDVEKFEAVMQFLNNIFRTIQGE